MKAAVIHEAGGPEVLKIETLPIPDPKNDEVLVRVKAFGLNRSEMFTRQGHSPGVQFPRVLGIEAAGVVAKCPGGQFKEGQKVATAMGGMGRDFNGGYAEYTCVKAANTQALETNLDWSIIGAVPEMLQTAYGSLFKALKLEASDRLLVRGGTTSVGLAAAAIAKNYGCFVAGTTRSSSGPSAEVMRKSGVDQILVDDGNVAAQVGDTFDKVLELIGTLTLADSLKCIKEGGIVCVTGIVGKYCPVQFDRTIARQMLTNPCCRKQVDYGQLRPNGHDRFGQVSYRILWWSNRVHGHSAERFAQADRGRHYARSDRQGLQVG